MADKIYVEGNYLVWDRDGSSILLQDSKSNVVINPIDSTPGSEIYQLKSPLIGTHVLALADLEDKSGTAYNKTSFESFVYSNTGFNSAGGSSSADAYSGGFFDYNDLGTTGTPISITGGGGFVKLTNDEAGANTLKTYKPTTVSDLWDSSTNQFDWSDLSLGDQVMIRVDFDIETLSTNTSIDMSLIMAVGDPSEYEIPFITEKEFKASDTHRLINFDSVYIGNSFTLNNPAELKLKSDKTCNVIVNGWYLNVIRRGL